MVPLLEVLFWDTAFCDGEENLCVVLGIGPDTVAVYYKLNVLLGASWCHSA